MLGVDLEDGALPRVGGVGRRGSGKGQVLGRGGGISRGWARSWCGGRGQDQWLLMRERDVPFRRESIVMRLPRPSYPVSREGR